MDLKSPKMQNKKIHLIGIGGVGMAGLAVLLKGEGYDVSGCDLVETPRTRWLEAQGIPVAIGHDPAHVTDVDEVIVTPAVHADNPELVALGDSSLRAARSNPRVRFRGEVLAQLVTRHSDAIAVCGSHGKTTTSTFIAKLLQALEPSVSWAIGGETGDFPVANAYSVGSDPFEYVEACSKGSDPTEYALVVEADESDGTLALYHARTLVITNCEYDHPDHFKTPEDYFACYETAKRQAGTVIESETLTDDGLSADIIAILDTLAPHNRKNARAAIEVALRRGHSLEKIAAVLPEVIRDLPDRRFQIIWPLSPNPYPLTPNPYVITDYAHHPTEMACAIRMARERCAGTLRVLFQPHRYSRTKALLADFPASFAEADEVILCPTYAAFESPVEGGDVADLYAACRPTVKRLFLARSCHEAWRHALFEMKDGDVTLLLGAGDIIKLVDEVQRDMANADSKGSDLIEYAFLSSFSFFRTGGRSVGGGARRVVGMGSNTWISDLTTDEEYVRIDAPAGQPGVSLGIPWMAGIPGTIGGWVKMNAGAFGHEISEVIEKVKVDGVWLDKTACGFGYRTSSIQGAIEDVVFKGEAINDSSKLRNCEITELQDCNKPHNGAASYLARRKAFPARCCGSVFKNPPNDFAGRLLEAVGAKDLAVGGARVWAEHANVIYATDDCTSSDILALARLMRERVRHRFNITLEPEICGLVL